MADLEVKRVIGPWPCASAETRAAASKRSWLQEGAVLLVLLASWWACASAAWGANDPDSMKFRSEAIPETQVSLVPDSRTDLPAPGDRLVSHASSIVAVDNGGGRKDLLVFWFAGKRESGADVEVFSSRFDAAEFNWSAARSVLRRSEVEEALGHAVRRIGNPVAWADDRGRVHLFVVVTGLGGWAASRILHAVSDSDTLEFEVQRVLPLSPLFNKSTLVRTPVVPLEDGGVLLPVYFELGRKYSSQVRFAPSGELVSMGRLTSNGAFLQPAIAAAGASSAIALFRDGGDGRRLAVSRSGDGGRTWSGPLTTNVPNPDSSVAVAALPDGSFIAALNPLAEGRHTLALFRSRDGLTWEFEHFIEMGSLQDEYSYPALLRIGTALHLTYTARRAGIRYRSYALR